MQLKRLIVQSAGIDMQIDSRWTDNPAKAVAFIKKDMKIAASYRLQFAFQFVQIFFSVTVIYFIGKMLGTSTESSLLKGCNTDYFSFALVGLAINSYLKAGLVAITNDIRQTMNQGTLEAMCATPIGYNWLLLCSSLWQFVFETVRVGFHFLLAIAVFGMRLSDANWPGAILCLILTVPIFMMLGIISCSILIIVKQGDPINWIFSSLSALLAGTMFPVGVLPPWLQTVAMCLPLTHSLEAMRRCLLAGAGIGQVWMNISALLVFIIILIPLTMAITGMCMKAAKRQGAFSTY